MSGKKGCRVREESDENAVKEGTECRRESDYTGESNEHGPQYESSLAQNLHVGISLQIRTKGDIPHPRTKTEMEFELFVYRGI